MTPTKLILTYNPATAKWQVAVSTSLDGTLVFELRGRAVSTKTEALNELADIKMSLLRDGVVTNTYC